jgi:diguanylate cyclase (GGDEF)-like protein
MNEMSFDIVTGAWSRSALQPRLSQEISRARRSGAPCSVFLFDVDFFKTVNDVYGHHRGDAVLRQIADRVSAAVRADDTLFRFGGDEFVVLLPDTGVQEAVRLALRLTEQVRALPFGDEPPLHLSISLGVATYPQDGKDETTLLRVADRRNYLAKHRGRGSAVADDAETSSDPRSSRLWERDTALAGTHHYLTQLDAQRRGALRVTGQPGAGHTRFLQEIHRLAALRGFTVLPVGGAVPPAPVGPTLLLADLDAADGVAAILARWERDGRLPDVLGVAYASTGTAVALPGALPELGVVDLPPWSPATQRIWLRSALQGEPDDHLVDWITRQSGGLPAAAARELGRLRQRDGLVASGGGGWTIRPELRSRPGRQVRLPATVTALVGRGDERARVAELLRGSRLVTLLGPGGIGKTRLSLAVAAAVADEYDDGAVFVALADTTTADEVVRALAAALDVDEIPGQPLLDGVTEHLAEASLLLVLDNLEQALDAAPVLGHLLGAAPGLAALATSREALAVYGEQVYRVPPLPLPDLHGLPHGDDGVALALTRSPAVALFDQRARAARDDFRLCPDNLPAVVELCRRLDGLPLAIELAAARTVALTPAALLEHLGRHLDALGDGPRDRPERQQTLRGAIDWSVALLDAEAQRLFEAVGVFTGGATAPAAAAVATSSQDSGVEAGVHVKAVAEALDALVAKSLLVADADPDGKTRYRMLETIRAYAVARLAENDPVPVRDRHRDYFATLADEAAEGMAGPGQAAWSDTITREYANLRTAMAWSLEGGEPGVAARICRGLWRYWRHGSELSEGRRWLDRVLAELPGASDGVPADGGGADGERAGGDHADAERATLLYPAAVLAATQDDDAAATRYGLASLRLSEASGDRQGTAQARNILGVAAMRAGCFDEATEHFGFGLQVWRELEQPQGTAIALGNLAKVCLRQGRTEAAAEHINECLTLERASGNSSGVLLGLECLGEILLAQDHLHDASLVAAEALTLSHELGDVFGEATALHQQGLIARRTGDPAAARELFGAALVRRHEVGDREDLAVSFDCLADLAVGDRPELAVRLLAAAEQLRQSQRIVAPPDIDGRRQATLDSARTAIGGPAFAAAWRAGRRAPLDLVVAEATAPALPDAPETRPVDAVRA